MKNLHLIHARNIDPDLAASLLEQIEAGAEVEPILLQLRHVCPPRDRDTSSVRDGHVARDTRTRDKVVTFQEDFSVQNI